MNKQDNYNQICDKLIYAVPRCLCGANIANCVKTKCYQSKAKGQPSKWLKECQLSSPKECHNPISQQEICGIIFDPEILRYFHYLNK